MRAEQDVRRFDVPVDDADRVRGTQGAEDGEADARGLRGRQRAAPQQLLEGLAADQLHDDPGQYVEAGRPDHRVGALAVRLLGDHVVDGDGRGVVDAGGRAGLTVEAVGGPAVRLVTGFAGQPGFLDGDFTVDELVVRPPDRAHAAGADALQQPVPAADGPPLGARGVPVVAHAP